MIELGKKVMVVVSRQLLPSTLVIYLQSISLVRSTAIFLTYVSNPAFHFRFCYKYLTILCGLDVSANAFFRSTACNFPFLAVVSHAVCKGSVKLMYQRAKPLGVVLVVDIVEEESVRFMVGTIKSRRCEAMEL